MQVDPIKPTLKPPGNKRLKLEYDELLSSFAFSFNLRRYTMAAAAAEHQAAKERNSGSMDPSKVWRGRLTL